MNQASGLFVVEAYILIIESFASREKLGKKTSGPVSGQFAFSRWEMLDENPHWEPTTDEEIYLSLIYCKN